MKRILFALWLLAVPAIAQNRIPATMVSVTNNFTRIPNTMTNVQNVLNYIDTYDLQFSTNYAPRSITTNTAITTLTPRWIGDVTVRTGATITNAQVWSSSGVTTSSWFMVYPILTVVNAGTFTNGQAAVVFARAMGGTPKVMCYWTDPVTAIKGSAVTNNILVRSSSITTTNFVPLFGTGSASILTNAAYIAVVGE